MLFPANYHTHTTRCHHAVGDDRDYVEAAIRAGYRILGFSDHVPFPFASGYVSGMRMHVDELPGYLASLKGLREEYADRLKIHIGFEAEYFPRYLDHLRRMQDMGVEYYILGQHWMDSEEDHPSSADACREDDGVLRYAEGVVRAMETGLYSYVCHPDILMRFRREEDFTPACEEATDMICEAAIRLNIPLEYNLLGLRDRLDGHGRGYPSPAFWAHASRHPIPVIIGVDAHDPARLLDEDTKAFAEKDLSGLGFRITRLLPMDEET
ncbi:MAG: histidinol-phosphatase [Clostridia bacterium]|nr:histidinol-phosphatase [Clostridia bacterium]